MKLHGNAIGFLKITWVLHMYCAVNTKHTLAHTYACSNTNKY